MAVISVRLNKSEDKMLKRLTEYFHADKSTLIKKSLVDLYENVEDLEEIENFESREASGKVSFVAADDILADK